MQFVDRLLRRGHMSERALTDAVLAGERPLHLEQCDRCADRALELGRWLDQVRVDAVADADGAFPPERLAAQHSQIMRRLEQLDEPARVIAFPSTRGLGGKEPSRRLVAPAWVGVAAAAGLVIGVIGGHASARLSPTALPTPGPVATAPLPEPGSFNLGTASLLEMDLDGTTPESLAPIDEVTPSLVPRTMTVAMRVSGG